jgi:hypothetical protein
MNLPTERPFVVETESKRQFRSAGKWTRGRWLFAIVLIFALHVGLILALSDRKPIVPRQPAFLTQLRLAATGAELFTLSDPTLFALPHASGFSGAGWMRISRMELEPFQWSEPPRWLQLPAEQLGAAFSLFMQTNEFAHYLPELKSSPQLTSPTAPPATAIPVGKSILLVEGELAGRKLLNAPALPEWPAVELLTGSIVQVLVDEAGTVISTVLLPPGSGSRDADQSALTRARSARFAPLHSQLEDTVKPSNRWTRGRMIFQWFTIPPARTNAPSVNP